MIKMFCRFCFSFNETGLYLPLTSIYNQEKEATADIAAIIRKHFDLPLDIDSDVICDDCWQQISEFHSFYLFIEQKQKEHSLENEVVVFTNEDWNTTEVQTVEKAHPYTESDDGTDEEAHTHPENDASIADTDDEDETYTGADTGASESDDDLMEIIEYDPDSEEPLIDINIPMTIEDSSIKEARNLPDTENTDDMNNAEWMDPLSIPATKCEINASEIVNDKEDQQNRDTNVTKGDENRAIFKCDLCAEPLESFENVRQHFKSQHNSQGYVVCCDKRFFKRRDYTEHLQWHSNPDVFKCEHCNRTYNSRITLRAHLEEKHPQAENLNFQCPVCPLKFAKKCFLNSHKKRSHNIKEDVLIHKCEECNEKFKSLEKFVVHRKEVHHILPECDICNKSFASLHCLIEHKKHIHEKSNRNQCPTCLKWFCNAKSLSDHMTNVHQVINSNTNIHKCQDCGKVFKTATTLKVHHKNIHLRSGTKICEICGKTYPAVYLYNRHKRNVHPATEDLKFSCLYCPKKFALENLLNSHTKVRHDKMEDECECDKCGKAFKSIKRLKKHKWNIHEANCICEICGKRFSNKQSLEKHKIIVHHIGDLPRVQCKTCDKWFDNKFLLYSHSKDHRNCNRNRNLNRNPYRDRIRDDPPEQRTCNICGVVKITVGALKVHMRSYHGNDPPRIRTCNVCGVVKNSVNALSQHKYVHHRGPTCECSYCGMKYKTNIMLKEHIFTHTGIPNFHCEFCSKSDNNYRSLIRHKKKMHKEEYGLSSKKIKI